MWSDHPFNQRNRITERTVGVGIAGHREVEGVDKIFKKGVGGGGDLHKIRGLAPLCQVRKETLKILLILASLHF